jgi:AraC-like DNA-binding protein
MHSFILRDDTLESGFLSLSKQLPAPIVDHTLQLPTHRGSGEIKGLTLEEGLYLRYTRLSCNKDIEIIRLPRQSGAEPLFSFLYLLTPGSLKLVKPSSQSILPFTQTGNIFLSSNNSRLSIQIREAVPSHTLELIFTRDWLFTQFPGMEDKLIYLEQYLEASARQEDATTILTAKTLPADEQLISEMETELIKHRFNGLALRSRILLLLANTISRWPGQADPRPPAGNNWNVQTIRQVEHRLVQSLEDMLPSQKELAKEFAMSESTLKRHFKAVYGKTMYEYYLEKKMELAKWLLQEKKSSVSETAYTLGYEKVSAFISMFKKIHKVLPGSFNKKEQ